MFFVRSIKCQWSLEDEDSNNNNNATTTTIQLVNWTLIHYPNGDNKNFFNLPFHFLVSWTPVWPIIYQYFFGANPGLFLHIFDLFHHNSNINWKSKDVVYGDRTWGCRMEGRRRIHWAMAASHKLHRPFTTMKVCPKNIKFVKVSTKFRQIQSERYRKGQFFYQSGEISPNLVTLSLLLTSTIKLI